MGYTGSVVVGYGEAVVIGFERVTAPGYPKSLAQQSKHVFGHR